MESIIRPFTTPIFEDLKAHVREIRRAFEGLPFHDADHPEPFRFNRWGWQDLPLLKLLHHSPELIAQATQIFGEPIKPSYSLLSMYSDQGICPGHIDRPQCRFTIDLCVSQSTPWEIFIGRDQLDKVGTPYLLQESEALCYSGTTQWHYRNRIAPGGFANMAFFHFVPQDFAGALV